MLASEAPEQQREDRHPHEQGPHKSQQIQLEKCVIGRAGRAPRSMRTFVVNEILASETPERTKTLECVPVKFGRNAPASGIKHSYGES